MLGTKDVGKINEGNKGKHKRIRKKKERNVLRITALSTPPFILAGIQPTLQAPFYAKRLVGWYHNMTDQSWCDPDTETWCTKKKVQFSSSEVKHDCLMAYMCIPHTNNYTHTHTHTALGSPLLFFFAPKNTFPIRKMYCLLETIPHDDFGAETWFHFMKGLPWHMNPMRIDSTFITATCGWAGLHKTHSEVS